MNPEVFTAKCAELRRRRFPVILFLSTPTFKAFTEEQRYRYLERVGICCGADPAKIEAHVLGMDDVGNFESGGKADGSPNQRPQVVATEKVSNGGITPGSINAQTPPRS